MTILLQPEIVDQKRRRAAVECLKRAQVRLPTFNELSDPTKIDPAHLPHLSEVDPDAANAANLWRVHWFNNADRKSLAETPGHLILPPELTGVKSPIAVLLGCRFPMIEAHKVLAAYACLVPRLVTGRFDPSLHRAVWPSTRELLPGRGGDLAHPRLSWGGRSSRGNES